MSILRSILILSVLAVAGCTPAAVKNAIRDNALRCERFSALIESGDTTRDQEQRFIAANGKAWAALAKRYE